MDKPPNTKKEMKDNLNHYKGELLLNPEKEGDTQAIERFIKAVNGLDLGQVKLQIKESYQYDCGCFYLGFSGTGTDCLEEFLKKFNEVFLGEGDAQRKESQENFIQAIKSFDHLQFEYFDFHFIERYLTEESYMVWLKDGKAVSVVEEDRDDYELDAWSLRCHAVFEEAYDHTSFQNLIDTGKMPLPEHCVLLMFENIFKYPEKHESLEDYLLRHGGDEIFFTFEDFWAVNGKFIHEWIVNECILENSLGKEITSISNTILLLEEKESLYPRQRRYTGKCVLDFFDVATESLKGPTKEDILFWLEDIKDPPLCVRIFLEEQEIGSSF